nr:hypothetical protein Iba_chr03bCG6720 [Ipomoea batatas]
MGRILKFLNGNFNDFANQSPFRYRVSEVNGGLATQLAGGVDGQISKLCKDAVVMNPDTRESPIVASSWKARMKLVNKTEASEQRSLLEWNSSSTQPSKKKKEVYAMFSPDLAYNYLALMNVEFI